MLCVGPIQAFCTFSSNPVMSEHVCTCMATQLGLPYTSLVEGRSHNSEVGQPRTLYLKGNVGGTVEMKHGPKAAHHLCLRQPTCVWLKYVTTCLFTKHISLKPNLQDEVQSAHIHDDIAPTKNLKITCVKKLTRAVFLRMNKKNANYFYNVTSKYVL